MQTQPQGPRSSPLDPRRTAQSGRSLRLLVLCHEFPPVGGGAGVVCDELSRHYVAAGHTVTILTMKLGDLPEMETVAGMQLHRIPCGRKHQTTSTPWEGLTWARRATRLAANLHRQHPFDLAHAHFIMPAGIVASRLKRHARVGFVITPHGADVPGHAQQRLKLAHLLARPWWQRICRHADRVVSPSEMLCRMIDAHAPRCASEVIPNGFHAQRFPETDKRKRILVCGRLVAGKGIQYLLEAIQPLDLPGWQVDIVGDGPMRAALAESARRCRVPVHMHGWIDRRDPRLAQLYGGALLFAFPSLRENFSLALLEAMSAGCAILTTDAPAIPEVVGDCARLVPPRNVAALRQAILEWTANPDACRQWGARAKARAVGLFDWNVVGRRYLDLVESLAGGEGSHSASLKTSRREAA